MKIYTARTKILRLGHDSCAFSPLPQFEAWALDHEDDWLVIEIKPWKPRRSLDQNAIWHKLLDLIAKETGNDLETVKAYIKEEYGYKVEFRGKLIPKPSHLYTSADWEALMGPTLALAAEYGISLP